jgi:UDP-N-acetylmuramate: L-alanyl-gamma-D-glutamyl-meso-diaminopimelate ligase
MKNLDLPSHIHIIGIAGVATSALAIAFHKAGVKVTGSDKGFYPPVSTELEKQGISFYAGWHPEKMVDGGAPDVVMIGTASGTQNPETLYIKEHNIPSYSYPEIIGKFFVKKNSIVCAGTWGKTTTSAILSHILLKAGFDPSYMFGGISLSHESAAHLGKSDWSVFEGDEYKSSPTDSRPKFAHYSPTHLLLTSVAWDHADLYPTEKIYFDAFEKLVQGIPSDGLLVVNADDDGVARVLRGASKDKALEPRLIRYGKAMNADYSYDNVQPSKDGLRFDISHNDKKTSISSPMLGRFNAENITAAFAMASELGVPAEKITAAIKDFKGIKRRLEKRFEGTVTVFDCHAPTPDKVASVLASLREAYAKKIIAVFEPNIGGRERASAAKYDNAFKDADAVIIPRLTKLKVANDQRTVIDGQEKPMGGDELANVIGETQPSCTYEENDDNLVSFLAFQAKKGDVIAFLGSHGFRGMIEEVVKKLT